MPDTLTTNSPIIAAYRAATPGSAERARRAADLFPSGITHDSRYIEPYGLYITRAKGPRKWDVDGRCYVDYFGGHGALLLGHCHPEVMEAVHAQLDRGTHYGASHELEIEWAERVKALIPTAERVRFTSSGTEATLMAVRLARAFTGKPKLIRFNYHFHGWHDHMTSGHTNHFDGTPTTGVLDAVAGNVLLCDQNDEAALARLLEQHEGEIAAAIIEPTGANGGKLPIDPDFLHALRRLTDRARRAADLRRGRQRVPRRAGRRAGGLRHPPGPDDVGENPRRRPARRRGDRAQGHPRTAGFPGRPRAPARRRSRIPARSTPTRCRRRPASRASRSCARPMPAPAPTSTARICAPGSTRCSRRSGCRGRPTARSPRSNCS